MPLQSIEFDWTPFLLKPKYDENSNETMEQLISLINTDQEFIEFHEIFEQTKYPKSLPVHLFKAITKKFDFFIDYAKEYKNHLNFNGMIFLGKPIL